MKLLLDTHVFIWWLDTSEKLSIEELGFIKNTENTVFISAASIWEISIKKSIGKIACSNNCNTLDAITENYFLPLPINAKHAQLVETLPQYHDDPFDRMLISQAIENDLIFITRDARIKQYAKSSLSKCKTALIFN
jgi:PIN domain nuclease of toxin-antitoxin system